MALREIIAFFGFDFDQSKADHVDKSIHGIKVHTEEAAGGVTGLIEAFKVVAGLEIFRLAKEFTESLAEQAVQIKHTSEATGVSTDQLQEWQFGAKQAGVDSEAFSLALRRLSVAIAGGKDEMGSQSNILAKMGIKTGTATDAVKTLGEALPKIADKFQAMQDGPAKAALAQELFGRQGARLIPILNKGSEGLAELHKEFQDLGGGLSPEAIERAEEFHIQTVRLGAAFDSFKSALATGILPRVTTLVELFTTGVAKLTEFAHETTLVESAVASVATALVVTLGGALAPFLFGALKFAAIYVAVDDLKGFLAGEDSEIGAILDGWFGDGTADVVRDWILDAKDWFLTGFNDIAAVFPVFSTAFSAVMASMAIEFDNFILGIENKWNDLVSSLGLKDSFKVDTTSRVATLAADTARHEGAVKANTVAQNNVDKYAAASTLTDGQLTTGTAPIAAPTRETHWNMVTNAPQISITVPPGTPTQVARDIARQTAQVVRDQHRAALQTLENRGG